MITVKHRSASGRLDHLWEFCPLRNVIELVIRIGNAAPAAFTIRVCSLEKPQLWCHPIARLDAESWRILPAYLIPGDGPGKVAPADCAVRGAGLRGAIPCTLHDRIGSIHVVLTNAPDAQDREIEALS
jgi:hypothetical protein